MIGAAWNVDNPAKPFADFDAEADIKIPIGLAAWLAELGVGYGSHEVLVPLPLECASPGTYGSDDAGTVLVRMRVKPGETVAAAATKYPFTIRVNGDDGTTQDDRTFYLKVYER